MDGSIALFARKCLNSGVPATVNHEEPGTTSIEVPDKNGKVSAKRFSECSVAEMRKAIQRKRKPSSCKPLPAGDMAFADRVMQSVTDNFRKGEPVRVQVRNHQGKAVLDFRGIPLEQLGTLVEALQAQLTSAHEVKEVGQPLT